MAKTKTVIFAIQIDDFKKILQPTKYYDVFVEAEQARFEEMSDIDELCGETIQKLMKMQKKMKDMKLESLNFIKKNIEKIDDLPNEQKGSKWKSIENLFRKKTLRPILKNKLEAVKEEDSIQKPLNSNADAVATNSTGEPAVNKLLIDNGLQLASEADQNEFGLRKIDITVVRQNKKGMTRTSSMLPRRTETKELFS